MKLRSSILLLGIALLFLPFAAHAQIAAVNVTGVAIDNDSFKVMYDPVPGAADYRIFDITTPTHVKYAGDIITGSGKSTLTSPSLEIEQNGVAPGTQNTYIVQALDRLGPFPPPSLYDNNNAPLNTLTSSLMPMTVSMPVLGSNSGVTTDGMTSTNGQGWPTNIPVVIAQSAPFTVTTGAPLSTTGATQVNIDDFVSGSVVQATGTAIRSTYRVRTPSMTWDIQQINCHRATSVFIMSRHLMWTVFDGPNGPSGALHTQYGVIAASPTQTAVLSPGDILHITMEVDAHTDSRRVVEMDLSPADDPMKSWQPTNTPINSTGIGAAALIGGNVYRVSQFVGLKVGGISQQVSLFGAAGQASHFDIRRLNGRGIDDRSRFDWLTTTTHFALFEEGVKQLEGDWVKPLPPKLKVFFASYLYHSALEVAELKKYAPSETFWLNEVPHSDERHIDNAGF
jgi:hypothetical protein